MAEIPSFRARSTIGVLAENNMVRPSPEFLRWLDLLTRQTDIVVEVVGDGSSIPIAGYSLSSAPSSTETASAPVPSASYQDDATALAFAAYGDTFTCPIYAEYTA